MKPPNWAYVIGILMLLFGGCGMMQDYQNIHAPKFLDMGEKFIDEIEDDIAEDLEEKREEEEERNSSISSDESDTSSDNIASNESSSDEIQNSPIEEDEEMDEEENEDLKELEMVKNILNVSDYYKKWMVRFGYIGMVVSFLFILAGVFLMIPKKFSIPLAYSALCISLLVGILQYIIFSRDESSGMVTMFSGMGVILSVVIDIILLAVVFTADKDAYAPLEENFT